MSSAVDTQQLQMRKFKYYKYSIYNIDIIYEDYVFIHNDYSNKSLWVDKQTYDEIKNNTKIQRVNKYFKLVDAGILVPDIREEETLADNIKKSSQNRHDRLEVCIAVTRICNYRCSYCFEIDNLTRCHEIMTDETKQQIVNFIKQKTLEHDYKVIKLLWFGGEPLLDVTTIKDITERLIKEVNIPIEAQLTTNGRFATKDIIQELHDNYFLKLVNITLDGTAESFAKIRGCQESDFDTVIQNIKDIDDIVRVKLRLNVINNADELIKLLEFLNTQELNIEPYITNIRSTGLESAQYNEAYYKYTEDYEHIINELTSKHIFQDLCKACTGRKNRQCQAVDTNHFVIDNKGNIYRCPEKIFEEEYAVGNVFEGITNKQLDYRFIENKLYDKCKYCSILPSCLGKCTMDRIIDNKGINCDALLKLKKYQLMQSDEYKKQVIMIKSVKKAKAILANKYIQ